MRRSFVVALGSLVALVVGVGLASGGSAGRAGSIVSADPAGDVRAPGLGLSKAERDAVDIVSVRVTGAEGLGVFVTVEFKGAFEARFGRGRLASAASALVLEPKLGAGLPAGLVSLGPGAVGSLYRESRSTDVGAVRDGNTETFWVQGPGLGNVQAVEVETVANARKLFPALGRNPSLTTTPELARPLWQKFITKDPMDGHVAVADPSALSCGELEALLNSINADLADPSLKSNVGRRVVKSLKKLRRTVRALLDSCGQSTVGGVFNWSFDGTNEVAGVGHFTGRTTTFTGVKVVLPSAFVITNHLCPTALPTATISSNSITCGGGTLSTGETFTLNLQTSPLPSAGMGGQLFGETAGGEVGPFTITGPTKP